MAKEKVIRELSIFINGKEIKNSLGAIGREIGIVKGKLREANDPKDIRKYKAELAKLRGEYGKVKDEIGEGNKKLDKFKKALGPLGPMILATFSIGTVIAFFKTIANEVKVLRQLKGTMSQITDLQGEQLDQATSKVKALADTFDQDTKQMTEAANNLSKQMGLDFDEALDMIKQGFLEGADANGDFLDKVREYPALLDETGLSAEKAIALMTQEVKQGIYSDKGVDAIKEANLRLREMTPAAEEALEAIGLSSENIQEELRSGSKTTFEIIQQVSERMDTLPPQSKVVGQAIADIFGGPGEDAGIKYLSNLHKIDLTTNTLISTTNEYARAKELEIKANEDLNDVWVKLTGTGSALNLFYSQLKSGLASLLGTITGVKDEAIEAKEAFEDQAEKVVGLEKSLNPLIEEYEDLRSKSELSKEEQDRLKEVIQTIGNIVPTAVTEFGKYGEALDINSEKAARFVENQKAMLRYRNTEVIQEETDKLKDLSAELDGIQEKLSNRNEAGDIVKKVISYSKLGNVSITEQVLSDNEIQKLRERAAEIEQLQIGVQASLDQHTGDYLTKFKEKEEEKTEKTKEEIAKRHLLEKTAADLKIQNIKELNDQELELAIAIRVESNQKIKELEKKQAEENEKERKAREEKEAQDALEAKKKLAELLDQWEEERILEKEIEDFDKDEQEKEREILAIEQKFAKLEAQAGNEKDLLVRLEEEKQAAIAEVTNKYLDSKQKKTEDFQKKYETNLRDHNQRLMQAEWALKRANDNAMQSGIQSLLGFAEKRSGVYKALFAIEKGLAIANIITDSSSAIAQITANLAVANSKALAMSPATFGQPFVGINTSIAVKEKLATKINAGAQIASIAANAINGLYYGGHTGNKVLYPDEYGGVVGAVHANEWVAPEIMTTDQRYAPTINWLEQERKKMLGKYYNGGHVASNESANSNQETPALPVNDNRALVDVLNRLDQRLESGINAILVRDYESYLRQKEIDAEFEQLQNNTRA